MATSPPPARRPGSAAGRATHPAVAVLEAAAAELEAFFETALLRYASAPPRLLESIRYSLSAGGKRLRPALALEVFGACGGSRRRRRSALAAAAALELIHTFSLVHDDLPAMDDDDLRRGRPTNHKVFGEATAILAGDAMTAMAFEILAVEAEPRLVPRLVAELAGATGPLGMVGGQVLDIEGEKQRLLLPQVQEVHYRKTGALLIAAVRMGAIAAGASARLLRSITTFGRHLGLAFQIVDDILDETATPEQLGKATGKDRRRGKNTFPSLLGLEESRRQATRHLEEALAALQPLGARARRLRDLARFVVERKR
jgi:geranylgeranyl diphosphate synthase type II